MSLALFISASIFMLNQGSRVNVTALLGFKIYNEHQNHCDFNFRVEALQGAMNLNHGHFLQKPAKFIGEFPLRLSDAVCQRKVY